MVELLPALIVLTSATCGAVIFLLRDEQVRLRTGLNLASALLKLCLVGWLLVGVSAGTEHRFAVELMPGLTLLLQADALSVLFTALSSVLWLVTTVYAVGYLERGRGRSRFFGFFSFCVSATVGVSLAGNLFTLVLFYEVLTLATYPLVVHRGSADAVAAGRTYLAYALGGGVAVLVGAAWLDLLAGDTAFVPGGIPALREVPPGVLAGLFALLVLGFGVKAALVPLHGWLPRSMVAPAPVSALLHAVAVVKAGAFGIVRTVYDVFGIEFAAEIGLLQPLAWLAALTVVYGSVRALGQHELKRRLAWSTVSQVSYIALGVATFGPLAALGGLVHLVHQGLMKITLFLCAGNLAERLGVHRVDQLDGAGRRMPWTMAAFTLGALGMIGVPPLAGFVSKWYLASGAVASGAWLVLAVLAVSTALNAAYFLPLLHAAWFRPPPPLPGADGAPASNAALPAAGSRAPRRAEAGPMLLVPPLVTAGLALAVGLLASAPFSPLAWVRFITSLEYLQ